MNQGGLAETLYADAGRSAPRSEPRTPVTVEGPNVTRLGDELIFEWPQYGVGLSFGHLREASEGVHGEIVVTSSVLGEIHWARINLASTPAREGLVKKLEKALPGAPWRPMLDKACRLAAITLRVGEPLVPLVPQLAGATRHLVGKLLLAGETNVLFGDGGSGKSLLALALAVSVATRIDLPAGLRPSGPAPVLYLDYESCLEEHQDRLAGLLAGLGRESAPGIFYRPMARALADDTATLRAEISRHNIGFIIVDSYGPACGAEPETADPAIRIMNALRSFAPATRLVIAHVSKANAEHRSGPSRPYGSVYVTNLARSVWEVRRSEDYDAADLNLGLFHRKVNRGRLLPPLGFRLTFDQGAIYLGSQDLQHQPDLLARASLAFRLQKALAGGARSVEDLVEDTGAGKDTVTRTLRRLRSGGKVITVEPDRWGLKA